MRPSLHDQSTACNKQYGAVWVEFLVATSFVLLSLFTLIPILAKITDIRHKTEQSAQYAVWERSVGYQDVENIGAPEKSETALTNEAMQRVLADGDTLVFSTQSAGTMEIDNFHYFLDGRSNVQNYVSLLGPRGSSPDQSLTISVNNTEQPRINLINGAFNASISKVAGVFTPLSLQTDVNDLINPNGYYQSNAQLVVKNPSWLPAFTSNTTLLSVSKSLLVDGWGAGGKNYNKKQVKKLQPKGFNNTLLFDDRLSIKGGLEGYRNVMDAIPVIDGKIGNLDFDVIDSDQLLDANHTMGVF